MKAGISAAGADLEDFFFPVLSPGWLSHFLWNEYYQTEEEFFHALADFFKGEYEAVVEAGFVLQIDDPSMVRSEEHTSELQSRTNLVCRLLLEKKKKHRNTKHTKTNTRTTV